ncbi:MAG: hypothetical protein WC595_01965 [Candidatus Nanoarchaeia archaeon]
MTTSRDFMRTSIDPGFSDHYRGPLTALYSPEAYLVFLTENSKLNPGTTITWPGTDGQPLGGFTYSPNRFPSAVIKCTTHGLPLGQLSIQLLGNSQARTELEEILIGEETKLEQ